MSVNWLRGRNRVSYDGVGGIVMRHLHIVRSIGWYFTHGMIDD